MQDRKGFSWLRQTIKNYLRLPKRLWASKFREPVVLLHQIYTHTAPEAELFIAPKLSFTGCRTSHGVKCKTPSTHHLSPHQMT